MFWGVACFYACGHWDGCVMDMTEGQIGTYRSGPSYLYSNIIMTRGLFLKKGYLGDL